MSPRRRRQDRPGAEFHITNRGTARRTIFDTAQELRLFQAHLACAVRREEIEILAYTLMRTHFHVYARSLGGLSTALHRIQGAAARNFNRNHDRDGPLFRGRFWSRQVRDALYRRNLVLYIDQNPVQAGICARPTEHAYGSAHAFSTGRRPPWLSPDIGNAFAAHYGPRGMAEDPQVAAMRAEFIEGLLDHAEAPHDLALDDLTPEHVATWLADRARLSDGIVHAAPIAGPTAVRVNVDAHVQVDTRVRVPSGYSHPLRKVMAAGLLRDVARLGYAAIGRQLGFTGEKSRRLVRYHWACVQADASYAAVAQVVVAAAVAVLR